jgi:hypothetical protein
MSKYYCTYSVVRYVPDVVKNEPRNIGAILQCKSLGYIAGIFASNLKSRLKDSAGESDLRILSGYIDDLQRPFVPYTSPKGDNIFKSTKSMFLEPEYLAHLSEDTASRIQHSESRSTVTEDVQHELNRLHCCPV